MIRGAGATRSAFRFDSGGRATTTPDQPAAPGTDWPQEQPEPSRSDEASGWTETVSPLDPTLFSIRFESGEEFLSAFRRELQHGGMFIKTRHPPNVDEEVTVEITKSAEEPVRLPARVVSRRRPTADPDPRSPPGINVDFTDLKGALEELRRLREIVEKS